MNKEKITTLLKARSKELGLSYNTLLSKFFFDEFLKLISQSEYVKKFLLKRRHAYSISPWNK